MAHWVGSDGEHVMVPRKVLDTVLDALDPDARDEQRQEARRLLMAHDDDWPSQRTSASS